MEDIFKKLAEPFAPEDIEWRVGNTNQKSVARQTGNAKAKPTKGMMLAYVTNRAIMNRLDSVVGAENWTNEYRQHHAGTICRLGIRLDADKEFIYKEDGADNTNIEPTKGGLSDAMKRAAVQFGIGRYLYDSESPWVDLDEWGRPKTTPTLSLKKTQKAPTEPSMTVEEACHKLKVVTTLENLKTVWEGLPAAMRQDNEVEAMKDQRKRELTK